MKSKRASGFGQFTVGDRKSREWGRLWPVAAGAALILGLCVPSAQGQEAAEEAVEAVSDNAADLSELSLEELMNVEVTSVSKKAEKRTDAAAAIFVLTNEDIRRAGVTSIPEALRLVPGVAVAHIDQDIWSVSTRGFSGRFANKLLVLVDGRSIYTPNFSGVFWEFQDVMLEDVDRIEVIRGPGGTLWGANAVNGVINIVTKNAADTLGGVVVGGIGTEDALGQVRYGGKFSDDDFYRLYTKYWQRDEGARISGGDADDDSDMIQGGVRMDFNASEHDKFTLQGDLFNQSKDQMQFLPTVLPGDPTVPPVIIPLSTAAMVADVTDTSVEGFNVLARFEHKINDDSDLQLQIYHDYYNLRNVITSQKYHITDIDFQHRFRANDDNEIVWGAGVRHIVDHFNSTEFLSYNNSQDITHIFSGFIQEEYTVNEDFVITVGTKLEHNDYTGVEVQPSARFRWNPAENQTLWGSASRAVRSPSRALDDIVLPTNAQTLTFPNPFDPTPGDLTDPGSFLQTGVLTLFNGDDGVVSEDLLSFELGYRIAPNERWAIDSSIFYNIYDDLSSTDVPTALTGPNPALPIGLPYSTFVATSANDDEGDVYGGELTIDYAPREWLRLTGAYSFAEISLDIDTETEGSYPEQMAWARARVNPADSVDLDLIVRFMDQLPALVDIDNYVTMDARIAWRPLADLELALAGRNLLEDENLEFRSSTILIEDTEVERSVYGQVTWKF